MTLRALLSFVSAHKIVCVCAAVGLLGGVLGFFAGLTAGLFAELIVRRVREEKSAPHTADDPFADHAPPVASSSADEIARAYATLELSPDASPDDIKTAHRRLAAQYHPDSKTGNHERFLEIQAAYETILRNGECVSAGSGA